jgi:V8-like Glu-specific endopeptidase
MAFDSASNPKAAVSAGDLAMRTAGLETAAPAGRAANTGTEGAVLSPSAEYFVRPGKAPPAVLETTIGEDERVRILDTQLMPWRMICNLRIEGPLGAAVGTGWLVGPRTVLTAGHCVHHPSIGGWAKRVVVTPGLNRTQTAFGSVVAQRFSALKDWVRDDPAMTLEQKADVDVGVIHLDASAIALNENGQPVLKDRQPDAAATALGDRLGWFGLAVCPDADLMDSFVHVAGYPGEPAKGYGREMWAHRSKVVGTTAKRIYYVVDTTPGQSGAPAFTVEADLTAPVAIAVHAYGTGGTPAGLGVLANSAPRITADLFQTIQRWIDAGPDEEAQS